jgi:hypothetical protein
VVLEAGRSASRVVVISALPSDSPKLARLWTDALRAELWQLDAAGVETYLVQASAADLEAMGPDLMHGGRAPLAVEAGRSAGRAVGPALREVVRSRPSRSGAQRRRGSRVAVATLIGAAAFAPSAHAGVTLGAAGTDAAPAQEASFAQY